MLLTCAAMAAIQACARHRPHRCETPAAVRLAVSIRATSCKHRTQVQGKVTEIGMATPTDTGHGPRGQGGQINAH